MLIIGNIVGNGNMGFVCTSSKTETSIKNKSQFLKMLAAVFLFPSSIRSFKILKVIIDMA